MLRAIVTVSRGAKGRADRGQLRKKLNSVYLREHTPCHTGLVPFLVDADSASMLDTDGRHGLRLLPIFFLLAVLIATHTQ